MSGIFRFLSSSIFGGTRKTDNNKRTPEEKARDTLAPPERRATTNASAVDTKTISERKTISLGASLSRIWIRLKYDSELRKAASDCKKLLASLSTPDFDLSTVIPLYNPLGGIGCQNFKDFYEKKINDTIKEFAKEAKKKGKLAQIENNLKNNINKFDSGRQESYNGPFRMVLEYQKAVKTINDSNSAKTGWTILPESSKK